MPRKGTSATQKILHNSMWFGLETLLETVVFFGTSIAVARYFGPTKLGEFSFINFFVNVITGTSGMGLSSATRKYMSEFLAQDKPGIARGVYNLASRFQLLGALVMTSLGLAAIFSFGEPQYRTMSVVLILCIVPGFMSWVPAQANNAFEDVSRNTISAFAYVLTYASIILLTLHFGWDLVGIAAAQLIGRSVEASIRTIAIQRRLRSMPLSPLPAEVTARIRQYSLQAIGLQLLTTIVWDRSELFILKGFSTKEQMGFYSVSFTLANNLLVLPRTFGGATGITLMVEASRDASRVAAIVRNAVRYILLVVFPVHLGAAAITALAVGVVYGPRYLGAIPVIMVASILAMPRAFQEIPEILLRAADRQKHMLFCYVATGIVNIGLDFAFIPHFGAVGAAWGNGLGQAFGVFAVWYQARRAFHFNLPWLVAFRLFVAGFLMAALAWFITHHVPGALGLVAAILTAIPVYILLVRAVHGLEFDDRARLENIGGKLPASFQSAFRATIAYITPAR